MLAALLLSCGAFAQFQENQWLPSGSVTADDLLTRPREALITNSQSQFLVGLGRLAFRSPEILGGNARRAGLSCNACHTNGHRNQNFFIAGLSNKPGHIDVTHTFWNLQAEDHRSNPLEIPSLRGVKAKSHFGHDRRTTSLKEFTQKVITGEFAGKEPAPLLLEALVSYEENLQTLRAGETPTFTLTLEDDLADLSHYLETLKQSLPRKDGALTDLIARMVRGELAKLWERFHLPQHEAIHDILVKWSQHLKNIGQAAEDQNFSRAEETFISLQKSFATDAAILISAAPSSLYNEATVRALNHRSKALKDQ